jgi:hypothetical protein
MKAEPRMPGEMVERRVPGAAPGIAYADERPVTKRTRRHPGQDAPTLRIGRAALIGENGA